MAPVSTIAGRAIPLGLSNVDTDAIIPEHWLKTITREGLGRGEARAPRISRYPEHYPTQHGLAEDA